jgi:hypothetical protein
MKQTAFRKRKNGEYITCLKYSVPIFVEYIYKMQLRRLAVRYNFGAGIIFLMLAHPVYKM